jgi:hypothetical protein
MTPQGLFDALEGGIDIATTLGLSLDPSWGSQSQDTTSPEFQPLEDVELPLEEVLNELDKKDVNAFLREYPTPREDIPPLVPISSGEFESILDSMMDSTY